MDLRRFVDVLKRHRWLIIAAITLMALVSGIASSLRSPSYRATARVLLRPNDPSESPLQRANVPRIIDLERYVADQVDIVRSPAVLEEAAKSAAGVTPDDLLDRLSVGQRDVSDVLEISVTHPDLGAARDLANAVATSYIENRRAQAVEGLDRVIKEIDARLAELQVRVADLAARIAEGSDGAGQSGTAGGDTVPGDPATAPAPRATEADATTRESLQAAHRVASLQYEALFSRQQELLVDKSLKRGEADLLAAARMPTGPVSPRPRRDAAIGAMVGLLLATGLALLREQFDDRLHSRADVEAASSLPVLAELPYDEEAVTKPPLPVAAARPGSAVAEAARSLRTSLQFVAVDKEVRLLVVTSAEPEEGKSFVASNLAVVCAQAGYRTHLVSADLRRPGLRSVFPEGDGSPGLTGVISRAFFPGAKGGHRAEMAPRAPGEGVTTGVLAALVPTSVPNLFVLPPGQIPPNPAELLASRFMEQVLEELAADADMVIVDTPPLLPVIDPAVLAARSDAVLMVVTLEKSRRDSITRAREILDRTGARVLGVVINKTHLAQAFYPYGEYESQIENTARKRGWRRRDRDAAGAQPPQLAASVPEPSLAVAPLPRGGPSGAIERDDIDVGDGQRGNEGRAAARDRQRAPDDGAREELSSPALEALVRLLSEVERHDDRGSVRDVAPTLAENPPQQDRPVQSTHTGDRDYDAEDRRPPASSPHGRTGSQE